MKIPQKPPSLAELLKKPHNLERITKGLSQTESRSVPREYVHWDKVRHLTLPDGWSHEDAWLMMKLGRMGGMKAVNLQDKDGRAFQYCVPDAVAEQLHEIDIGAGGTIGMPEQITNPQTRDQYVVRSLMEEAITSSQLEGAVTTRKVA